MDRLDGWLGWCGEAFSIVEDGGWEAEFDWFAVDEDGFHAVLTSAGSARFPSDAVQVGAEVYLKAVHWVRESNPVCGVKVWEPAGDISNWVRFEERGLFAFDAGNMPLSADYSV